MPICPVSVTTDMCGVMIMVSPHQFAVITPPASGIAPSIEAITNMLWPPGFAMEKNKFTSTVMHKNLCITLDGHDLGPLLIHAPTVPSDIMFALSTAMSSRKTNFSAGMVQANGTPIACATGMFVMTVCASPVSLPTGTANSTFNTVIVNISWDDVLAGVVQIGVGMLLDFLLNKLGDKISKSQWAERWLGRFFKSAAKELEEAVERLGTAEVNAVVQRLESAGFTLAEGEAESLLQSLKSMGAAGDSRAIASLLRGKLAPDLAADLVTENVKSNIANNARGATLLACRHVDPDYHGPATLSVGVEYGRVAEVKGAWTQSDEGSAVSGDVGLAGGLAGGKETYNDPNDGEAEWEGETHAAGFNHADGETENDWL